MQGTDAWYGASGLLPALLLVLHGPLWLCSTNVLCVMPKPSAGTSANVYRDQ